MSLMSDAESSIGDSNRPAASENGIAILDFGSQYTHLIGRRVRGLGVNAVLLPPETNASALAGYDGIVLSGGPASVKEAGAPLPDAGIFDLGLPILGLCYGHQLMVSMLGGAVRPCRTREYGKAVLTLKERDLIFDGLGEKETVWMSHGDLVEELPPGFRVLATTSDCPTAAIGDTDRNFFGLQFHPEVHHTPRGMDILRNFVRGACGSEPRIPAAPSVESMIEQIRRDVEDKNVFLFVSGGVDSTVAFVLLTKALGPKRVYGLHINNGFLRLGEMDKVKGYMDSFGFTNFHQLDATRQFHIAVKGLTDPEAKRKAVARTFLDIKDKVYRDLNLSPESWLLGQGTIYPDLITSGVTKNSDVIKTHHNSLLDERGTLLLIEPMKDLYKDEVRELGLKLGMPRDFLWKEPFPGPGNSVRVLGEVTPEKLALQAEVDAVIDRCLKGTKWYTELWHKFPVLGIVSELGEPPRLDGQVVGIAERARIEAARRSSEILDEALKEEGLKPATATAVFIPVRSVGIKGDAKAYEHPMCLLIREKNSWIKLPDDLLERVSSRITNQVDGINRVVYDLTQAAPDGPWDKLIFLRMLVSTDTMTADWGRIDEPKLREISREIMALGKVDRVMLDITQKPPGMMEWE
jgi:GMP synthase (glutamine-hydrolysing)